MAWRHQVSCLPSLEVFRRRVSNCRSVSSRHWAPGWRNSNLQRLAEALLTGTREGRRGRQKQPGSTGQGGQETRPRYLRISRKESDIRSEQWFIRDGGFLRKEDHGKDEGGLLGGGACPPQGNVVRAELSSFTKSLPMSRFLGDSPQQAFQSREYGAGGSAFSAPRGVRRGLR